jgi:FkbM family methyltransferase
MRTIKKGAKSVLGRGLRMMGHDLIPLASPMHRCTMEGAMRAMHGRGHGIRTVVDVGASDGSWSGALMRHFPACQYLLVEAQPVHDPALRAFCARHPNAQYVLAAAGDRVGRIHFDASDPFGGLASYEPSAANDIEVPVVTVDGELKARGLQGPYLLKLDTHGFEVPILKGAAEALAAAEVLVVECYNFRIAPECLTFDEMCRYLGERGFRCIDLVDPLYRPRDDAFWQMDLVFIRKDRPEFSHQGYR